MDKRGELTTQQIVTLVILVASFAVILFFILRLNLGQETDQEICHNSVITRGNSPLPADTFPLKCKRQYVCLSFDGTCEKMTKPEVIKVKNSDEVYKALADQLAECWWMFGEGKVNYAGSESLPEFYCAICSQITFDDSVEKDIFNAQYFDKKSLYEYMAKNKYSGDQTYLKYLLNTLDVEKVFSGNFGKVNLTKQYYSLTGMTSDVNTWGWVWRVGAGTAIIAGGLALAPFTGGGSTGFGIAALYALGGSAAGGAAGGLLVAPVIKGLNGQEYVSPSLIGANSKEFYALNCSSILTSS